jgi:NTP pyrophosphatase (non-canonical NTP hydrolase)|tara:strand:+ start:408 stop:590 length:183 start_codon:yes stop_codon:yes gene_type:complete
MKLNEEQRYIFLKCAEELNELSVELLQAVNKPNKNNWEKIFNELKDVNNWVKKLKEIKDD